MLLLPSQCEIGSGGEEHIFLPPSLPCPEGAELGNRSFSLSSPLGFLFAPLPFPNPEAEGTKDGASPGKGGQTQFQTVPIQTVGEEAILKKMFGCTRKLSVSALS